MIRKHYFRLSRYLASGLLLFLLLLAFTGCRHAARPSDYRARIGVAVQVNGRICMAIDNAKLLPGALITLLAPSGLANRRPATARALIVSKEAAPCLGTKNNDQISSYNLKITAGSVEDDLPLIALESRLPSVYAAHSFHACSSVDGIHLTAWDGAKPLEGHRLWKQYYYLDRDLKSTCTPNETAP